MESVHASRRPVYESGTRPQRQEQQHNTPAHLHLHLLPSHFARPRSLHEHAPPSKRRRANSVNPAASSPTDALTLFPLTPWQPPHSHSLVAAKLIIESSIPRSISPDHLSRVSVASSQPSNGPQLRKKPKSSSIKNTNTLRVVTTTALPKSPSLPTFHSSAHLDHDTEHLVINHYSANSAASAPRTTSGLSQQYSPSQKRPPASHSSYGIETTCGPPPSYSTQRTLSQERIRKVDRNTQTRGHLTTPDTGQSNGLDGMGDTATHNKQEILPLIIHSSPDTADTQSIPTPTDMDNMPGIKLRGEQRTSLDEETKASSSDERKSEDLFLNIARVDATRPPQPKNDKRRSRISIPFLPSSRQSSAVRSSPIQSHIDQNHVVSPRSEAPSFHNKRASLGGYMPHAASSRNYLPDTTRFRETAAASTPDHERDEIRLYDPMPRRSSTANTDSTRLAHRSSAGLRSNRSIIDNTYADRPKTGEQIATESTISTTAPSTVWDELDDLKSRIRKLEITGKLPLSSAAAMTSMERPRTATTAATTMSTSPKYKPSDSNLQAMGEGMPANVHPLLYEALENARAILSADVYDKLQATAQDAMQLAAMMNTENAGNRSYGLSSGVERQIRRRTESMCRGLTELAIALSAEAKPVQSIARPASRDQSLPPNSMLRSRRYSNDPADRGHGSVRVQSRLDSRRTSVQLGRSDGDHSSPERGSYQSPGVVSQLPDPRLNRSSTLLRKRGQGSFDGVEEPYEASPSVRPGSRAMTDLGAYRRPSRDQIQLPREYTSQYPLPLQQEHTLVTTAAAAANAPPPNSHGMKFNSRRKFSTPMSSAGVYDSSPITPRDTWTRMVTNPAETQSPDVGSEVGGLGRMNSSQGSLGFAGRIGSSVGSRLRAVRAERNSREQMNLNGNRNMVPPLPGDHTINTADVGIRRG